VNVSPKVVAAEIAEKAHLASLPSVFVSAAPLGE
jgi:hypothetical protein